MRYGTSRAPAVSRRGHGLMLSALTLGGLWLAGAAGGCASPTTDLTVTSLPSRQTYHPGFKQAYSRRNDRGDVEVVAACDLRTASGAAHPHLKQVMHIRVLWSPGPGLKTDQPANSQMLKERKRSERILADVHDANARSTPRLIL